MKKSILKSLEPKTKTLFRFANSAKNTRSAGNGGVTESTAMCDPTTTTIITTSFI